MASPNSTLAAQLAGRRIQKESKWWGMHEKCCEQFPDKLDAETRAWFNYNSKGNIFLNLPLDQRMKINELKNRLHKDFNGKLPLRHSSAAVEKTRPKDEKKRAYLPADGDMAAIANADPSMCNTEIVEYWANFISRYKSFQGRHGKPSEDSQNADACYLAKGYEYCCHLASIGALPLEIEILYSKINQSFDLVGTWRKKLEQRDQLFAKTGSQPSFSIKSQRHLAHWLYTVSNLHARNALPEGAFWLAVNFKRLASAPSVQAAGNGSQIISELDGYMALAGVLGEENIVRGSAISDASRWADWRGKIVKLHAEGKLPPDVVSHFKARGAAFLSD